MRVWVVVVFAALCVAPRASAQADDVTFLVMGKTRNDRQHHDGSLSLLNYHFFAEIFVKPGGFVEGATLGFPDGAMQAFEDLGFVQEVHGGRYDREADLDRAYPNGDYTFRFDTGSGRVDGRVMRVRGTGEGRSRIPEAVRITLRQSGAPVDLSAVDPDSDLVVSWSSFAAASRDENGILDDLLFVVMGDCRGEKTVHSGRPFEGTPFLSHDATGFVIPAARLAPGEPHQLFVEHAIVDTSREAGIVGLVTYAATSFLDFQTRGRARGAACPDAMPRMDGGQTDRRER